MANYHFQAPAMNGGKGEGSNPGLQFPPYQPWPPQQYPGYNPHPWYPPYQHQFPQQEEAPPIKQELDQPPHVKQEVLSTTEDYTQEPSHPSASQQCTSQYPLPPQEASQQGPPEHGDSKHPLQQGHPQYPPPRGHPQFPPYFASYPPQGFNPGGPWNPYNYNSMPPWNGSPGQYYHPGWPQFQQGQQPPQSAQGQQPPQSAHQNNKQIVEGMVKNEPKIAGDNSVDVKAEAFEHNTTSELDNSSERTSDLGSSLNNSSGGESDSPERTVLPVKMPAPRMPKYTDWEEDELTLMPGWKKRSYHHGIIKKKTLYQYLSPTQEIFDTRGQMVEHLKLEGHSEEDITRVASGVRRGPRFQEENVPPALSGSRRGVPRDPRFMHNDWVTDESLPSGWLKRSTEWKASHTRVALKFTYLAPDNRIFSSRNEIVSFMRDSDQYSEEDVEKVLSGKGNKKRPNEFIPDSNAKGVNATDNMERPLKQSRLSEVNKDDSSDEEKEEPEEPVIKKMNQFTDWSVDATLPEGWKVRSKEVEEDGNVSTVHQFLSPDRKVLGSRAEVDEYLKTLDGYKEDIKTKLSEINESDNSQLNDLQGKDITHAINNEHALKNVYQHNLNVQDKTARLPMKTYSNMKVSNAPKPVNANVPNLPSSNVQKPVNGNVAVLNVPRSANGNVSKHANGNVPRATNGNIQNLSPLNIHRLGNINIPNLPKGIDLIPMKNMQSINVHENKAPGRILTNVANAVPSNQGRMLPNSVKEGLSNQADWENDESLPNGWKRRSFMRKWMTRGEMKTAEQHQYLCTYPTRQIFSSRAQVVEYMQRSNYPEHEIRRVKDGKKSVIQKPYLNTLLDNNGLINSINKSITITPVSEKTNINKNITITKVGENPGIPQLNSNITVTKVNISPQKSIYQKNRPVTQGNGNWETDNEILPQGWKKRSFINAGAIKINQYLGPNHQLFSSSEEVFKFMKNSEHYNLEDAVKFLSGIRKREEAFKNPTVITKKTEITKTNITNYIPIEPVKRNSNLSAFNGKFNNIPFPNNIIAEPIKKVQNNISLEAIKENFSAISVEKANTNVMVNVGAIVENKSIITVDVDADDESTEEKELPKLECKQNDLERNFEESYLMGKPSAPEDDDGIEHIETVTKHDWVVDKSLPEGWKRRPLIGHSSQRKRDGSMVVTKYQYLSPEHDIFNSRREIMSYMESYTNMPNQEQIQKLFIDYDKENEGNTTDVLLVNSSEEHEEIYLQDKPKENILNESENVKLLSKEENCAKYPYEATIEVSVDQVERGKREAINDEKDELMVPKEYEIATDKIENTDNVAIEKADQQDIMIHKELEIDNEENKYIRMDVDEQDEGSVEQIKKAEFIIKADQQDEIMIHKELKIDNEENKYISMDVDEQDEGSVEQIKKAEFIINLDDQIELASTSEPFNIDMKNEQDLLLSRKEINAFEDDVDLSDYHIAKENLDEHKEESKIGLNDIHKYNMGLDKQILNVNESMDQEKDTEVQNYAIYEEVIHEDGQNYAIYEEVIKEDDSIYNYEQEVEEQLYEDAMSKDKASDNDGNTEKAVLKELKAGNNATEYECSDDTEPRGTEPSNNDILPVDGSGKQEREKVNDRSLEENMEIDDTISYEEVNMKTEIMESNEDELIEGSLIEGKKDNEDELIESSLIESNHMEDMKTDNIGPINDVLITEVSDKEKEIIHNKNDQEVNFESDVINSNHEESKASDSIGINPEESKESDSIEIKHEESKESDSIEIKHEESKEIDSIEIKEEANIESNSIESNQNMSPDVVESSQKETEQNTAPIKFMEDSIGPRIIIQRSNFEMLSQMFATHPNPSKSVMEDICDDTEMSAKDVKWTFIKLRHKFDHTKGEQVDKEDVGKMIETVRRRFSKDDLLEL